MSAHGDMDPELARVARLLDDAAAQEARDLAAADALETAPGLERVESTLADAWGARRSRRPRLAVLGMIAAAAAIVLFVLLRGFGAPPTQGPRGEYLGDEHVGVVHPSARAQRFDRIEWSGPPDATYRLSVRAAETGALLLGPRTIMHERTLALDAADTASWPRKIVIELELRRADGTWTPAESRTSELAP